MVFGEVFFFGGSAPIHDWFFALFGKCFYCMWWVVYIIAVTLTYAISLLPRPCRLTGTQVAVKIIKNVPKYR